jgi:hypothetical protein
MNEDDEISEADKVRLAATPQWTAIEAKKDLKVWAELDFLEQKAQRQKQAAEKAAICDLCSQEIKERATHFIPRPLFLPINVPVGNMMLCQPCAEEALSAEA